MPKYPLFAVYETIKEGFVNYTIGGCSTHTAKPSSNKYGKIILRLIKISESPSYDPTPHNNRNFG